MQHAEVATGVRRLGDDHVNWYLIEVGQEITVIDAGMPAHWWQLESALRSRGRGHRTSRRFCSPMLTPITLALRDECRTPRALLCVCTSRCRSRCPAFPTSTAVSADRAADLG
jgi:hypothetical protein